MITNGFLFGKLRFAPHRCISSKVRALIEETIQGNPVVVFMKGTPQLPECGFSKAACQTLRSAGVAKIVGVNVLQDEELRQGIKEFSDWPTIPQVFVNGRFVGGSDIVAEMHRSGSLKELLGERAANSAK